MIYTKQSCKKNCIEGKVIIRCTFIPELALTGFRTILYRFQQVNLTSPRPALGQRSTSEKHKTSVSCKLEPTIWSCDTGQQIPCFDRCQLIITWISAIKEVHCKPRLHVSVNLLFGVWPPCCVVVVHTHPHEQYQCL